jgi:nitroreductase
MDVFEAIKERRSVRAYKDRDVEEEKLRKILEAARLSPSASNRQEWKFIVVKNAETRAKLAGAAYGQRFIGTAPVVIVACATEAEAIMMCGQPTHTVDVSIACAFMILEAQEQGIGACWVGAFNEGEVKKILAVPNHMRVVTMMPLGYPDESPDPRPRKSFGQVVCFEKY